MLSAWLHTISTPPEVVRRVLVLTSVEVLTIKSLLVHLKLLLAFFVCDSLCLLKVHRNSARGLGTHRPLSCTKDMLLHLVGVNALGNGSVSLVIIAVKARLDLALFLLARSAAECVPEDVLTFDRRYVALVAWHTI